MDVIFGRAKKKDNEETIIYCPDAMCIKFFKSIRALRNHLDFREHLYQSEKAPQLELVERFTVGSSKSLPTRQFEGIVDEGIGKVPLEMGCPISKRVTR